MRKMKEKERRKGKKGRKKGQRINKTQGNENADALFD